MKLGELRAAIRNHNGNPFVRVRLGPGHPEINLVIQKSKLYEALDFTYPGGKAIETNLSFDPSNGMLSADGAIGEKTWSEIAATNDLLGDDDLLV